MNIKILDWEDRFAEDFINLSLEWLEKYLWIEPADEEVLYHPHEAILDAGGMIFFANNGTENIGTVALIKMDEKTFELVKLGVTEAYKGNHISRLLMDKAISYAREKCAEKIILFSNSGLVPALKLYETYGFQNVPVEDSEFEGADVKMELLLS